MCQQHTAQKHVDAGQELQLMITFKTWMSKNVICDFDHVMVVGTRLAGSDIVAHLVQGLKYRVSWCAFLLAMIKKKDCMSYLRIPVSLHQCGLHWLLLLTRYTLYPNSVIFFPQCKFINRLISGCSKNTNPKYTPWIILCNIYLKTEITICSEQYSFFMSFLFNWSPIWKLNNTDKHTDR